VTLRLPLRLATTTLVAAVVALLGAGPALAAPTAEIGSVDVVDGSGRVLVSLVDAPDATADLAGVQATLGGQPLEVTAELASAAEQDIERVSVLAIDVSRSMRGERFAAAKLAATAFIQNAPADVQLGIVGFADAAEVIVEPTLDRAVLTRAVDSLTLTPQTMLYDGIAEAARVASIADSGSVLVLSDGKDTSGADAADLSSDLAELDVKVDVVALEQDRAQLDVLAGIAEAARGTVINAATPRELTGLFTAQAAELAGQIVVSFDVPADWKGGSGTLSVSVPVDGVTVSDEAFVSVPAAVAQTADTEPSEPAATAPTPVDTTAGLSVSKPLMIGGVIGIGVAILIIALAFASPSTSVRETVSDRLEAYTGRRRGPASPSQRGSAPAGVKQQALELTEKALSSGGLEIKVAARLESAGMKLNSAEWLLLHSGIAVLTPLVAFLVTGGNILFTLLAVPLGIVGPWFYLGIKHKRRVRRFSAQLPETLQLISGSLSAGLAFNQALDTVVREGSDPMASEFRRALVEARLGVNIEDALDGIAERMGSEDFAWMVMAIKIQREVGGNLAELLLTVSATLREREYLRRQVKTLSAEGRLSAWILGGMPPFFVGYLALAQPTYLAPLFTQPMGWLLMGFAGVLMVVGVFWLMKSVKVEI